MFLTIEDIRAIARDLSTRISEDCEDYQAFVSVPGGYVTSDCWDDITSLAIEADGTVILF
jgi:hypothetical protein